MPIIGWIRDLFGIQKDMYETKKTRLEIEKIEEEKREKLITPATLEDVLRYNPKIKELIDRLEKGETGHYSDTGGERFLERILQEYRYLRRLIKILTVLLVAALLVIICLIYYVAR